MISPPTDPPSPAAPLRLRRVLGLWEVTAGGVGLIIGAGIYVLIGTAAAQAGAGVWLSFLLAAVLSALTGLSYAELAARFPSSAAEYEFTRQVFPRWVALLVGWIMIAGLGTAAAAVALGFARYSSFFLPLDARLAAFVLIVLVTSLALRGIRQSTRVTLVLSSIQVGGLLLVIAIGLPHLGQEPLLAGSSVSGVLGAAALVFFAYMGFDEVITLAEETVDPAHTVPRALLLALGISAALYVATAMAAVSVLGASALGASPRPLADVIGHVLGDRSAAIMAGLAIVSTTNTTLLILTAASRLTYGMASQGALPAVLAYVDPDRRAPLVAILLAALIASLLILVEDLALVASVTDVAVFTVFLAVNATVIVLRWRAPDAPVGFHAPLQIGRLALLPGLALVTVLVMLTHLDPRAISAGALLCVIGGVAARLLARRAPPPAGAP